MQEEGIDSRLAAGLVPRGASSAAKPGVLLIQLGTPDAPTAEALRPYLRQFLGDPRVIEDPPWFWPILFRYILWKRPADSAAKYARIWDKATGSPLLHWTRRQVELLQVRLPAVPVRFGMQVGNPALAKVVEELLRAGVDRFIVLPMYPQYSATTWASATDALFNCLCKQRRVPALRIVPPYFDHPAYLDAMARVINDAMAKLPGAPDHRVLSFHGIPQRYADAGDPYAQHVDATTRGLIQRLGWHAGTWTQSYQSLFGRELWLKPYTEEVLRDLARQGKKRVFIAMPGFTADCLETLDEIGNEARETFQHVGGESLHVCPCLNDHPSWIDALQALVTQEGQGWL